MDTGWHITANDIKEWVKKNKRRIEELLPELIERLIRASGKPKKLDFPSGDSISTGGWDGMLEIEEGNEYIPVGKSVWEFGTEKSVNNKANEDYKKRTNEPGFIIPAETTFVFVTSQHWRDKNSWCANKNKDKIWKDVRGINADDLKSWLSLCPAVHRWFAEKIGKITAPVWEINQAWESWSNVTTIPATYSLVLNGRTKEIDELKSLLNENPEVISIISESTDESYAFCLAMLIKEISFSSRVLIIKDQTEWDKLINTKNSLILIPQGFNPENIGFAKKKGHFVLVPGNLYNQDNIPVKLDLPRMTRIDRTNAIISLKISENNAWKIYSDTKGYLSLIRRHKVLGPQEKLSSPEWINFNTSVMVSALFATEWDRENENDKQALARLSSFSYEEFEAQISDLSSFQDAPIRLIGNIWQVISKSDFYSIISYKIGKQNIERLKPIAFEVLKEYDPSFELEPKERYLAVVNDMLPKYSSYLKKGIASTLGLLAVRDKKLEDTIEYWVKELFENNISVKSWYSLREYLELLAEAAPDSFLQALENTVNKQNTDIAELFIEGGSWGGYYHTDLLRALEKLAWSLDYLPRVTRVLGKLSEIDPGGNVHPRPLDVLEKIYIGWKNNTEANHSDKIEILDSNLITPFPNIALKLLISLIPKPGMKQISYPVSKPVYRDWGNEIGSEILLADFPKYIFNLSDLVVKIIKNNPEDKIPKVIKKIDRLTDQQFFEILDFMLFLNLDIISLEWRLKVIDEINSLITFSKKVKKEKWALKKTHISKLEEVFNYLKPDNLSSLVSEYLFTEYNPPFIQLIIDSEKDYNEREKIIKNLRNNKVVQIYNESGLMGLINIIENCPKPELIGLPIYYSEFREIIEPEILSWLEIDNAKKLDVAKTFIYPCANLIPGWTENILKNHKFNNDKALIKFVQSLPFNKRTFDLLESLDKSISNEFWKNATFSHFHNETIEITNWLMKQFLDNNRPFEALSAASVILHNKKSTYSLDNSLLKDLLIKIGSIEIDEQNDTLINSHHLILEAISYIQEKGVLSNSEVSQIEWIYIHAARFDSLYPKFLIKELQVNPSFFAQLVSWYFIPEEGITEDEKIDEIAKINRGRKAIELLDAFSILPGTREDGSIDETYLKSWVFELRKELKKLNRSQMISYYLGNILSNSPKGTDGIWPHETVRNLIEELQDEEIESSLRIQNSNSRGITVRDFYEGGNQERNLARKYLENANLLRKKWPRTSEIYRKLSKQYESLGDWEDQKNELKY